MDGPLPVPCESDAQCRQVAEDALRSLVETQSIERRVLHSQCVLNPCGRETAICDCVLDPGDGRDLEWESLGNLEPCTVVGRGPACLMQRDDYTPCNLDDPKDCTDKCEAVADLRDADDARLRDIEIRYAACVSSPEVTTYPPFCISVVRIDSQCYFDEYGPPTADGYYGYLIPTLDDQDRWSCELSDEEIVSKYFPTPDWEALGCTVEPNQVVCETPGGQGACFGWLCLDRACYGENGLDYALPGCTCPVFDFTASDPDNDAGVTDAGP